TFFRNMHRGDVVAEKAMPEGLKITRRFYKLTTNAKAGDGGNHFHAEEIKDGHVKAGETILMKVFVYSPRQLPYVMVEAPLPSGAE
ncbi:hypothetical protein ABTF93_19705, partial [Acinetobacter baumannii]